MPRKAKAQQALPLEGTGGEVFTNLIANGLAEAIGFGNPVFGGGFGFPANQAAPWTPEISQPNTEFINLRWYLISNMRQFLSEMYVELGLVQNLVNVPVDDALRGGVDIKSQQLSEDQIKELKVSVDRDDDLGTAGWSAKWNRLFGGSGILTLTDQDPIEPLDIESITRDTPLEFRAVDMWELFWDKQSSEGYDPTVQLEDFEHYNYYGEQVHKSRVMRLTGMTAPSFIRPRLRGWGFSITEALVRSINQYLKATTVAFELLDEYKVDIYKIKNLTSTLLSPQGTDAVRKRIAMANYGKNFQNAVVMDTEDDWDHKQLSFTGWGEIMREIRTQVSSDMRIPMLKLFGTSAQGLNASDEESLEVYNSMVESDVRNKIKYPILRMLEIKCQKLFGFIPDDLEIEFKPLRVLSAPQEEEVKGKKFDRLIQSVQLGKITDEEFRDACNKGNLFDVVLDNSPAMLTHLADVAAEGENDPDHPQDDNNPGADRADSRKPRATEVGGLPKGNKKPPVRSADAPLAKAKASKTRKTMNVRPWPLYKRLERIAVANSAEYDRRAYEADGGDGWIDDRRREFFSNPGKVDEALWAKAKEATHAALGRENWKFTTWWYKKHGGKFDEHSH